jgi:hypothetical protein
MLNLVKLANLVFPNNATDTNMVEVGTARAICIFAPGTVTGTITIQVSHDDTTYYSLQLAAANIAIAVNTAVVVTNTGFRYLRLHSGSAEGGIRTFIATMQEVTS